MVTIGAQCCRNGEAPPSISTFHILSKISFTLTKTDLPTKVFWEKKQFPVASPLAAGANVPRSPKEITFAHLSSGTSTKSIYVYAPHNNVARPRNKFIIARTILSRIVKTRHPWSTNDVSKIISKVGTFSMNFSHTHSISTGEY